MRLNLPLCDDWTDVNVSEKLVDIITRVSGRVFVGPDLCQVPEYLNIGSNYTVLVVNAIQAVKRVRPWLRPFLVPRLPEIKKLRAMEQRAAKHLEPIVRGRLEGEKNDPNWQKPDDMMQWLMDRSKEHYGVVSVEELAFLQLGLIFAAVHTTSLTATNIIYTLAVTPEYIKPLREEIITAMSNNDGQVTTRALGQMVKLDSYMKEVMRLYPLGLSKSTPQKPLPTPN
jgi:cytochrome P450